MTKRTGKGAARIAGKAPRDGAAAGAARARFKNEGAAGFERPGA
jgi:hypothetical protein